MLKPQKPPEQSPPLIVYLSKLTCDHDGRGDEGAATAVAEVDAFDAIECNVPWPLSSRSVLSVRDQWRGVHLHGTTLGVLVSHTNVSCLPLETNVISPLAIYRVYLYFKFTGYFRQTQGMPYKM